MKQFLYVYIPGFEYDSKGPLHIDAIRADVTAGEIEKNNENKIQNSLKTYLYISPENTDNIEGNLIYRDRVNSRASGTLQSWYNTHYAGDTSKAERPFYTADESRAIHGFFYDFITTSKDEEKTHHVIGIHKNPRDCSIDSVSNFNQNEHDGLFAVELKELNTDLTITLTFYSRIKDSTSTEVGQLEDSSRLMIHHTPNYDKFNSELNPDFFNEYIEIGKWTQTYNPATSGFEQDLVLEQPIEAQKQYFDITWGETDRWDFPVHTEMLVTDMSNQESKKTTTSYSYWQQYSYDNKPFLVDGITPNPNYRKYYLATDSDQLNCNKKTYSNIGDYYLNFYPYPKMQHVFSAFGSPTAKIDGYGAFFYYKAGLYYGQTFNTYMLESDVSKTAQFNYNLSNIDLTNFRYLYKDLPKVKVVNLVHDSEVGDDSHSDCLFLTMNTVTRECRDDAFPNTCTIDCWNHDVDNNDSGGRHYGNSYCGDGKKPTCTVNNIASIQAKILETLPGQEEREIALSNPTIKFTTYRNHTSTTPDFYKQKTLEVQVKAQQNARATKSSFTGKKRGWYLGTIHESTSDNAYAFAQDTILDTGEKTLTLSENNNNDINVKIELGNTKVPVTIYGDYHSGMTATCNVSLSFNWRFTQIPWSSSHTNYLFKYGDDFGYVYVGLPQMYQINLDLNRQDPPGRFSNASDWSVIPILTKYKRGYQDKTDLPVNIDTDTTGNLLDPDRDDPAPEITRIVDSSYLNKPSDLLYKKTADGAIKCLSTFCNEERFIGIKSVSEPINKRIDFSLPTLDLTSGLYILRIQYANPNDADTIINFTIENEVKTVSNLADRFVFYVKDGHTCPFNLNYIEAKLKSGSDMYNMISGIGLYKVLFDDNMDTNTANLKQTVVEGYAQETTGAYVLFEDPTLTQVYSSIIFTAAFCAKEDVEFCPRLSTQFPYGHPADRYKVDYDNDYCTSLEDDPIYHYYNFKYLPTSAEYEVVAYYKVPSGSAIKPSEIDCVNTSLENKLEFIKNIIVRL